MKLVQFRTNNQDPRIGVYEDSRIFDSALLADPPRDIGVLISGWAKYQPAFQEKIDTLMASGDTAVHPLVHDDKDIELLAPANPQGIIICVGMNYPDPAAPLAEKQLYPVLFLKDQRTIHHPCHPIILPLASEKVFCEGELAVIIGRSGRHIPPEQALDYVFGYTIANDVGARDLESRTSQWATGKLPDTFLPLGPLLVTADEIADVSDLPLKVAINDEPYLEGHTGEMIFTIPELIAYISAIKALQPGDMIITGSPKGLGRCPSPVRFLEPGDSITITIDPIGQLTNPVVDEAAYIE